MKANKRIIGMIATVTAAVVLTLTLIVVVSKRISAEEAQPNQTSNAASTPGSAFLHESLSAAAATSGPEPALDQETVIVRGTASPREVFTESPATEDPKVLITKELNNEKEPQTVFPQRNDLNHIDYKKVLAELYNYRSAIVHGKNNKQNLSHSKYLNRNCYDIALDIFRDLLREIILNDNLLESDNIPSEIDKMIVDKI